MQAHVLHTPSLRRFVVGFAASLSLFTGVAAAQDSTVLGVAVKPSDVQAGTPVSATASGSGLCGAVHIDWGDGTAITYATSTLPVTQSHTYKYGGAYTVRAQGMGNCTGQATTRVNVSGPPPPPPPPPPGATPTLSGIDLSAPAIAPKSAVTIAIRGEGTCRMNLDFGDGNTQEVSGPLPQTVRHTYALPGRYSIVASPIAPCTNRQAAVLDVRAEPAQPRILSLEVSRPANVAASVRAIRVNGTGTCAYTLEFGDGNSEGRNASLPDVVQHNYPADGRYTAVAVAAAPCTGTARSTFVIGDDEGGTRPLELRRVTVTPVDARPGETVQITLQGSGRCRVTLDFGDDRQRNVVDVLPFRVTHRYSVGGDYEIVAWTYPPCEGGGSTAVRVRR